MCDGALQRLSRSGALKVLSVLLAGIMLGGCGASGMFGPGLGRKYEYTYRMITPAANKEMVYQDDCVLVQFRIDEAAVQFQLQNVSDGEMTIDWTRASLGVEGRFWPVRHSANLYSDTAHYAPIIIPTLGYVRDLMIPVDNIGFDGTRWFEKDLLPTVDRGSVTLRSEIERSTGKQISVMMPLRVKGEERVYEFAFAVTSVREISWRDYHPTVRVPEPPPVARRAGPGEQVTFGVVTFGIISLIAFILTLKKNPPSE